MTLDLFDGERRQEAGASPIALPSPAPLGFLVRAGYAGRLRLGPWMYRLGMTLVFVGFAQAREWREWALVAILGGFGLALAGSMLKSFIRCRVCGVNLRTCEAFRALPGSRQAAWLDALEECPVCGDDGSASSENGLRWRASGGQPERAYWSAGRIGLAVLLTGLVVGGGFLAIQLLERYMIRR